MKRKRALLAMLWLVVAAFAPRSLAQNAPPPPPPPEMATDASPVPETHASTTSFDTPAAPPAPTTHTTQRATPTEVFHLDFMQRALVAGTAVGLVCAYLGLFVVLRRVVFVGMALAEFSSAGVAAALIKDGPPMVGSILGMLVGTGLLSVRWAPRKVRQDTVIGIGYVAAAALAILILSGSPKGEAHLLDILSGNILTVTEPETIWTCVALVLVLAFHRLFAKELLFVSFDADTAQASGYNTRVWDAILTLSIGIAIAVAVHAVGTLMTFGSLLLPAVTALLVTRRMNHAFWTAMLLGAIPVPVGLYLSFIADLSPGATIVGVNVVLLCLGGLVAAIKK